MWRALLTSNINLAQQQNAGSCIRGVAACARQCLLGVQLDLAADPQASARHLAHGALNTNTQAYCSFSSSSSQASTAIGTRSTQRQPWQLPPHQQQPQHVQHLQQQRQSLFTACSSAQQLPQHQQHHQQQLSCHNPTWRQQQPPLCQLHHQFQQQRGVKQLRPYDEAPKLPPRFRKPSKDGRMNRMVIRIPPQVQVAVQDGKLLLTGKAGSKALDLATLDPSGLVAWQCLSQSAAGAAQGPGTGSLLLMVSPIRRHWRSIQTHVDNAVAGVMQGYLVGLTVQGVGYRLEPVPEDVVKAAVRARRGDAAAEAVSSGKRRAMFWEQEAEKSNIAYPHKQPGRAVRLKVGFTKAAIFPLPEGVLGFFVKPTLMYLYGTDKHLVTNTAAAIRAVRKPNAYTGNGIQLVGEQIKLKQRAGSK